MRGKDEQQLDVFSYVSPEQRVPQEHPLRSLRAMTDEALRDLQPRFHKLYAKTGRPSIAPEKLLRALLLQALYSVRSERLLMEQLDYNLLFRWFVGLPSITRYVFEPCPSPLAAASRSLIPFSRASGIAFTYLSVVTAIVLCRRSSFAAKASPVNCVKIVAAPRRPA